MNNNKKYYEDNPWMRRYHSSKSRAKLYGMEHTITKEYVKEIWFRDKGWELVEPSIDRIDPKKGYIPGNCRIIEKRENSRLGSLRRPTTEKQRESGKRLIIKYMENRKKYGWPHPKPHAKPIEQLTLEGKVIRQWESCTEASTQLGIDRAGISRVVSGQSHTCGGFKWRAVLTLLNEPQ